MCACTLLRSAGQDWNRSLTVVCQTLKSSPLKEQKPVKFHFTPLKESLKFAAAGRKELVQFQFLG